MNFTKGQKVLVKDYSGKRLLRRVWIDYGEVVSITSEEGFSALESGRKDIWPIGVRKIDVEPEK